MSANSEDNKIPQVVLQIRTVESEWLHFDNGTIFAGKTVVAHASSAP